MRYYCDNKRHLICLPFGIENLHKMAEDLSIKRGWFHNKKRLPHYDIPKKRIKEIQSKCIVIHHKELVKLIQDNYE